MWQQHSKASTLLNKLCRVLQLNGSCFVRCEPYLGIVQGQLVLWTLEDTLAVTKQQKYLVIILMNENEQPQQKTAVEKATAKDSHFETTLSIQ